MGSMNCKEYVTATNNDACTANGTSGSYQPKIESKMSEYTDPIVVCNATDIAENEMKQLDLTEDTKILLIKQGGVLHAIGNKCSHYGAPLHTGVLGKGRVRCPWHGACFNITTGDIEDFPGLDSLPCYKVVVDGDGQVKVQAKRKDLESTRRIKDMEEADPEDDHCCVIVGGGPAGAVCAETLRQEGFTGRIVMLCRELCLPYDRIKLSKAMDIDIETLQFRNAAFYEQHSIEVMLGITATEVNAFDKTVDLSDDTQIRYNKMFIATGSRPLKPNIPGIDLKNIFTLRDHLDAKTLLAKLTPETIVVCMGSSFIALETAAYVVNKVKCVTVVGRESVPLKRVFGELVGQRIMELFEENGVEMIMNSGITEVIGNNCLEVRDVVLKNGSSKPCDLLILGTGTRPNTDFLIETDIRVNENGSIDTNDFLMTNGIDVYAGGDIANAPVYINNNKKATIGHFQLSQYHGRIAALNMMGNQRPVRAVPFFWTMVFGKGFRYSGYGSYNDVLIDGDLQDLKFVAYFINSDNNVVAVASCGRDPIVSQFAELLSQGKRLRRSDVEGKDPSEWLKMLHK